MSQHGTAFVYSLGQFAEANSAMTKALAQVLPGFDPKDVLEAVGKKGSQLELLLQSGIATLINGDGTTIAPEQMIATPKSAPTEFSTFLTGRIGIYKTLDAVKAAFGEKGCKISDWSADVMTKPQFVLSQEEQDIKWVAVSARQLGFKKSATRVAIIDRAEKDFGLDRCQPEDGVYIRLGHLNQPNGEWRLLAMDPITDSDGGLSIVFVVGRDGRGLWLDTHYGSAGNQWNPDFVWLFRRRKSLSS